MLLKVRFVIPTGSIASLHEITHTLLYRQQQKTTQTNTVSHNFTESRRKNN